MTSSDKKSKKRKRTKNTTAEQYEIYISLLESDLVFKSGIINPTLEDNYIQKKWLELSEQLNSCGEGPHLTSDEWKKRFTDWKYAVRAKSRKILEHKTKTGSGPPIDIKLTEIEEKALSLWGKIVITGTPFIDHYDGIPSRIQQIPEIDISSILHMPVDIVDEEIDGNSTSPTEAEQPCSSKTLELVNEGSTSKEQTSMTPVSRARHRPKPMSVLTEKLINISQNADNNYRTLNSTLQNFFSSYMEYKKEKLNLEEKKLSFDLAKYKFENPNFPFHE